jgi:hypothetical protein
MVSGSAGLYAPPPVAQLGRGTFDYIDIVFVIIWAWTFQSLSVNDGLRYQFRLGTWRASRSRASDVGGFAGFFIMAVLWGVFGVHNVFAARAVDPDYVSQLPPGTPTGSLQHGVAEVTITYFVIVALLLIVIVIARMFNPVDFDEYARYARSILHRSPREPAR